MKHHEHTWDWRIWYVQSIDVFGSEEKKRSKTPMLDRCCFFPLRTRYRCGRDLQSDPLLGIMNTQKQRNYITLTIHVWYIHLHLVDFYGKCRYIYHAWILWVILEPFDTFCVCMALRNVRWIEADTGIVPGSLSGVSVNQADPRPDFYDFSKIIKVKLWCENIPQTVITMVTDVQNHRPSIIFFAATGRAIPGEQDPGVPINC